MSGKTKSSLVDYPAHLMRMGQSFVKSGRIADARALARKAMEDRPGDGLIREVANAILMHRIPRFHQSMLQDRYRNQVYRQGIDAEAAGRRVLDIGTGSGLLAMMAARAGAEHVYACEADDRLAATAREIVAKNGFADKITVIAGHSTELDRDADLGSGVDLVISEIFSNDLLSEGVLPSLRDAHARLCLPGATFLPGKASVRVALIELSSFKSDGNGRSVGTVEGFDLGLFERHVAKQSSLDRGSKRIAMCSTPADLFTFDFGQEAGQEDRAAVSVQSLGGLATGILQWIAFENNSGSRYENKPQFGEKSHWGLSYRAFDAPVQMMEGANLTICGWRNDHELLCWLNT